MQIKLKTPVNRERIYSEEEIERFAKLHEFEAFYKLQENFSKYGRTNVDHIYFNLTEGLSHHKIQLNHQDYINFSSYNYLGTSGDPYVKQAAINAIEEYGTSVSASRIVSGEKPLHQKLEQTIAKFVGLDASLTFTAGHATNVETISHLFGEKDLILHDALIHNSSLQGIIFSGATHMHFPHNNYEFLEKLLHKYRHHYERILIVIEGLYSMDGDIPYLPEFLRLKKQYKAFIMVDEAHSIGVLGKTGRGISEHFGTDPHEIDIMMGTLSKSLGSCGGFIAADYRLIEFLKFTCGGFIYSAGMTPPNAAAALASLELIQKEPERLETLHQRSQLLLDLLTEAGINTGDSQNSPIIPVVVGPEDLAIQISLLLREKGIYALPLFYPAVKKRQARIRFFVSSTHTEEEIRYTGQTVIDLLKGKVIPLFAKGKKNG